MGDKKHKRTHLGIRRLPNRPRKPAPQEEAKPVTAAPPVQAEPFMARVEDRQAGSLLERAPGCFRTYTPPEGES